MDASLEQLLATVGPRLRGLRQRSDLTLTQLASATDISVSTLSRLESGQRRPNLELSGQVRLILGEHDLLLKAGEAAAFDTRVPHWFDRASSEQVEILQPVRSTG